VIAVEYRLAPQYPFPAAVDDTVAVYKHVLKQYAQKKIGVYGTSAGAVLVAQMAVESRRLALSLRPFWAFSPAMPISPATETPGFSMARTASQTSIRCFLH
jgi:acetyl esterase/lipase